MTNEKYSEENEMAVEEKEHDGNIPKTEEEIKEEMEDNREDEEVYSEEGREKLIEDDEIEDWEEGFMEGAEGAGQLGKDALTGEPLTEIEQVVEIEFKGRKYRFINQENAEKFKEKHK